MPDILRGQGIVLGQELAVFAREDVVRDRSNGEARAEGLAKGKHQSRLAGADGTAHGQYCFLWKLRKLRKLYKALLMHVRR